MPFRFCVLLMLSVCLALGQEYRASINGEVTDPSGAPVDAAKVTVRSLERNTIHAEISNSAGRFVVPFLQPGRYTVTVEKPGFRTYVREDVAVASSDRVGLAVRLELGAVADSVTVTGETPVLQTETASRSSLIENRSIETVPTNGRNLYQLQYTLPGVVKTSSYWGSMELYAFGNINGVTISGGRSGENETLIDGVTNTRSDRGVAYAPSLNGTQEFTIQTNTYDAQYGRVGGGVTSIVVKSGTNTPHGQLFEFLKNDRLNANDWIANKNGEARVPFKQSTFGFEVDGPIYIPKVFDGRNRMFFMLSLEGLREHSPGGAFTTLPTPEQLQGDFSGLLNADGEPVTIYDPTTAQLGANGRYTRTPFAGNRIPANRINPVAAKVASYYPAPTGPGDGPDHENNYGKINPSTNSYDSWLGKYDYRVTNRSNVSFRYGQTPWGNFAQVVWGTNAAEPSGEAPSTRVSRNWGADWTYTLSPALIFNLRGGLARYEGFSGNVYAKGFDPRTLGFPSSLVGQYLGLQFPRFNLGGTYSPLGATRVTNYETHDTYSIQPNMSWVRGRHALKFGTEFRLYNRNQLQPGAASGTFTFAKNWTQADPLRGDALSGNEFASFLLGLPTSGSVDRNIDPAYQNKYYALFLQDDWKITPRLTLNLGLRWDYETPRTERYDRQVRGFAFDQASPIAGSVQGLSLRGGLIFAGSGNRRAFNSDRNNFQPRIGVAWQMTNKWVLRAGYGLTYLGQSSNGPATGFSQPTNLIASTDNNITPAVSLSDPFPSNLFPNGLLKPIGSTQGLATNLGQAVTAQYLDRPLPYSHQFSFGFQRELPNNWLADVSYVGNITRKLPVSMNLNFIPTETLNSLPVDQRPAYFSASVPNPMAGLLPNSSINGASIPRQQLLYAYPQFSNVTITDVPVGRQRYDALQTALTRRFSAGLAARFSYTWSKTLERTTLLNQQDINLANLTKTQLEKRLYDWDVPHKFAAVVSYELPVGRGKRFGSHLHPILNGILGNWNLNGQTVVQSGFIFNFPNAAPLEARSAKFSDDQRDALAKSKGRTEFDPSYDKWFDTSLFPNRAQAPYTLRNFPSRFPDVRSRGLKTTELSIFKEFPIRERVRWQVRCDFQNAFNFPFFSRLQSNDVTNSRFGQLTADIGNEPRRIVAVMKVTF